MSQQKLLQKTVLTGMMACMLGLGACALNDDEGWISDDTEFVASSEEVIFPEENEPCVDEEACVLADDYLSGTFVQTETTTVENKEPSKGFDLPMFGEDGSDDVLALSRPAGSSAVAVKDKAVKAPQSTADKVFYSAQAVPETTERTIQVSSQVKEAAKVPVVAPVAATAVVPVAVEKETVAAPVEPVVVETKVVAAPVATEKEKVKVTETVSVSETKKAPEGPVVEADETLQTAISVPGQMMPLKKVRTTITETTTKIKRNPEETPKKDFRKMTLKEKVAYGESSQEWEANVGSTLRTLLMDWGNKSGWTVVWKLDRDYNLEAGVVFQGTFTEVSSALIRSFARATPAPIGTFYQGNRVLVINTQEDENER